MARLSDPLTRPQQLLLEHGTVTLRVDLSPIYPGCYIAGKDGKTAAGSSPRLAVEGLLSRLAAKG